MYQLAWLSLNDEFGRDLTMPVAGLRWVREDPDGSGSIAVLTDGSELKLTESVSDVATAVDTLWDEYLAALP